MHTYTSDSYTYHEEEVEFFAFNPCSTFVHRYNSLMQDNGLYFDPDNVVMTTQVQRNNIKFYNYDLQSIATNIYLDIYQPLMDSKEFHLIKVTSATKEFQGVYDEQFGIFRNSGQNLYLSNSNFFLISPILKLHFFHRFQCFLNPFCDRFFSVLIKMRLVVLLLLVKSIVRHTIQ